MRLFILLAAAALGSASPPDDFSAQGAGTKSCADFASLYRTDPQMSEDFYFSWAQGMMSGMNTQKLIEHKKTVNLNSYSISDQKMMIRSYCDAHPLWSYFEAVFVLYNYMDK